MSDNILDASEELHATKKRKGAFLFCLLKYSGILTVSVFLVVKAAILVKEALPQHQVNDRYLEYIIGLLAVLIFIATLIFALKEFFKTAAKPAFLIMLALGALICAMPFTVIEIAQSLWNSYWYSRINSILIETSAFAGVGLVISFFITFQLKTRKTLWTAIIAIVILAVAGYFVYKNEVFR